jgi:DNA-binding response OmpR family regulator
MYKIVLVDDDRAGCHMLSAALKSEYHSISAAYDAHSGFALVLRECPDLLILDLSMPAGGDLSLVEKMRKIPELADIPIIVVTATDDRLNRAQASAMGASALLSKPIDGRELRMSVSEALARAEVSPPELALNGRPHEAPVENTLAAYSR